MKTDFGRILEVLKGKHGKGEEKSQPSPLFRQILVASGPLISTISLGMTSGFSAILLPQLQSNDSSIIIDQNEASWIASMAALPMAFGCILGGFLMEHLGRRSTQLITTLPCLIGWTLIAFSPTTSLLLTGRFLTGLCGGLLGPSTGVYVSETSHPRLRGLLLGAISLAVAFGLLFVHVLGTFLSWKTTALVASALPLLSMALLSVVPESPAWLGKKGRIREAEEAAVWCGVEKVAEQKPESKQEVRVLGRGFLRPLGVVVVFIVTNQWAGVNALSFYTVAIMRKTLNRGLDEYVAMLIVDLIRVVMSVVACIVMKKIGRRPLALFSGLGTASSLFMLSGYTYIAAPDLPWYYTIIPMVALVSYIGFITVGFVPLPWAMMGEVFPLEHRNVGSSIASFMAFAAFFSVVKTSPVMFDALGAHGTFLVYGMVAFWGTVFNWVFLPETKDKTLQEIEEQFCKSVCKESE